MFASVALGPGGKTLWVGRFLSCTAAIVVQSFGWVHVFISLSFTNILCKSICILVLVTESDTPSRGQVSKPLNFCKSKIQTKPFLLFIPWKGGDKLPCNPHYCHFVTTCRKWTLRTGCCGLRLLHISIQTPSFCGKYRVAGSIHTDSFYFLCSVRWHCLFLCIAPGNINLHPL